MVDVRFCCSWCWVHAAVIQRYHRVGRCPHCSARHLLLLLSQVSLYYLSDVCSCYAVRRCGIYLTWGKCVLASSCYFVVCRLLGQSGAALSHRLGFPLVSILVMIDMTHKHALCSSLSLPTHTLQSIFRRRTFFKLLIPKVHWRYRKNSFWKKATLDGKIKNFASKGFTGTWIPARFLGNR